MARALQIANKELATLRIANEEMKPKALFADAVSSSHTSILIRDLAKLIKQNGVDIGQNRLFEWLRNKDYLIKSGSDKNMPTQKAMNMNLLEIKEGSYINGQGANVVTRTPKVTGKGQIYFINKFLGGKED
jgi:anti-repressor protein